MNFRFARTSTSKFRNVKTEVDGTLFASKAEAARYLYLKTLLRIGEIDALELQPRFNLVVNGQKVCAYIADFRYRRVSTGDVIVEDVTAKPTRTPEYRIKKKLLKALCNIDVAEIY